MALSVLASAAGAFQLTIPTRFNLMELAMLAIPVAGMLGIAVYMAFFAME
jgi:hypothetical protein